MWIINFPHPRPFQRHNEEIQFSNGAVLLKSTGFPHTDESELSWAIIEAVLGAIMNWTWEQQRAGKVCRKMTWTVWDSSSMVTGWEDPKKTMHGSVESDSNSGGTAVKG